MQPPHRQRRILLPLIALAATLFPAGRASAFPDPGRIERVSVSTAGAEGDGNAWNPPAISADGRFVAFSSAATNLVPGDTNGRDDVFVRDRLAAVTQRVSVSPDGSEVPGGSTKPAISADGRYVVFTHSGTSFGKAQPIVLHDRTTGVSEAVSITHDGLVENADSFLDAVSADGRYVVFQSIVAAFVPGDTGFVDIFVRDRVEGRTFRASEPAGGGQPNGGSGSPTVSADGRYVAFTSSATNLVPGDTNARADLFLRDLETGTVERIVPPAAPSMARISATGRFVAFVAGDQAYVHDRQTDLTERVSIGTTGQGAAGAAWWPAVSDDGRFVSFTSSAANLIPEEKEAGQPSGRPGLFVRDRVGMATDRITSTVGTEGHQLHQAAMTPDGRLLAVTASDPGLVPGDTNGRRDVFVIDRGPGTGVGGRLIIEHRSDGRLEVGGWARFSGTSVTSGADPAGDAAAGSAQINGDLTGAQIVYRPERDDLLVRMQTTGSLGSAHPGLYEMSFEMDGTRWEVHARTMRTPFADQGVTLSTAIVTTQPYFALFACRGVALVGDTCQWEASLEGGFGGRSGNELFVQVPLSEFLPRGRSITNVRASTAIDEWASVTNVRHEIDSVTLPGFELPEAPWWVDLGIAPAGSPEGEVDWRGTAAILREGFLESFTGTFDPKELPSGDYDVWARACTPEGCGALNAPISL